MCGAHTNTITMMMVFQTNKQKMQHKIRPEKPQISPYEYRFETKMILVHMRYKVLNNLNLHQPMRSYITSILQYLAISYAGTAIAVAIVAAIIRLCYRAASVSSKRFDSFVCLCVCVCLFVCDRKIIGFSWQMRTMKSNIFCSFFICVGFFSEQRF